MAFWSFSEQKTASAALQSAGRRLRKSIGCGTHLNEFSHPSPRTPRAIKVEFFSEADTILLEQYVFVYSVAKGGTAGPSGLLAFQRDGAVKAP